MAESHSGSSCQHSKTVSGYFDMPGTNKIIYDRFFNHLQNVLFVQATIPNLNYLGFTVFSAKEALHLTVIVQWNVA